MPIQNGTETIAVVANSKLKYEATKIQKVNEKIQELNNQGKEVINIDYGIPRNAGLGVSAGFISITWKKDDQKSIPPVQTTVSDYNQRTLIVNSENFNSIMKRIEIFLGDGDWDKADSYCEAVLDYDPDCAMAYVYKLLAKYKSPEISLLTFSQKIDNKEFYSDDNYIKAIKYADAALREKLHQCQNKKINIDREKKKNEIEAAKRAKAKELEETYQKALRLKDVALQSTRVEDLVEAKKLFDSIKNYKDSAHQLEEEIYKKAMYLKNVGDQDDLQKAIALFSYIMDYKDSSQQYELSQKEDWKWAKKKLAGCGLLFIFIIVLFIVLLNL